MKCEIIRDLMPLYLDDCCSEGSRKMVEEHIKECDSCRKLLDEMSKELIISTEEQRQNLLGEELLETGKEVIRSEMRRRYLKNTVWFDIPLNILVSGFGVYALHKISSEHMLYTYESFSQLPWREAVWFNIYEVIGNPHTMGLALYFLVCEIMYLVKAKNKKETGILTCIALESVCFKIVMFVIFAVIGLMLLLRK